MLKINAWIDLLFRYAIQMALQKRGRRGDRRDRERERERRSHHSPSFLSLLLMLLPTFHSLLPAPLSLIPS